MPGLLPSIPRVLRVTPYLLLLASPLAPAAAQITVTVQGGVHAARLDRPERAVVDPDWESHSKAPRVRQAPWA